MIPRPLVVRLLPPGGPYYLLVLTAFVAVFALIPLTLFMHSGEDWAFQPALMLRLAGLGLALGLAVAVVVRLVAVVRAGAARWLACAIFCLGLFLLAAHVYAPLPIGPLDGSEIESPEPWSHTAIEVLILALLLPVLALLGRGRGLPAAASLSALLLAVTIGYFTAAAMVTTSAEAERPVGQPSGATVTAGNVYHIVLDRMQTDAFLRALRKADLKTAFPGFHLFKNNVANYISTISSSASYMTGTLYKDGSYQDWTNRWHDEGLFALLSSRGYETWMFAPFGSWQGNHIDHFYYNVNIYEAETGLSNAGLYDFIHVWLATLAPTPLTNEALPLADRARGPLFRLLTGNLEPLSIEEGVDPYSGMLMLRKLRSEEERRPPRGQYIYAHAALPHTPFVIDRNCNYVGRQEEPKQAYLEQAQCAVRLVANFLAELKRLGRYDSATIIVHADTGHGIGGITGETRPGHTRTLGVTDVGLVYTLNALLMVKRPGDNGPLQTLETPTQLVDLFPTILDMLALQPPHEVDGKSVYAIGEDEDREARFGFDPDNWFDGPNIVEVRIENPRDPLHSDLNVLGPVNGNQR